ncbi:hypothetical protein RvY_12668 [Ramazzottius varieornatus]|uniref:WAP domain-containing protein n=1 Tax=Ramazzottius varieornatus TaxID=947166 RepID=A0A1D1VKA0_RAMVA|nr:hypothetical protein RvY_12668 [Ramazzottius varieornatus]
MMAVCKWLVILLGVLGICQTIHCGHAHGQDEDGRGLFDALFDSIQSKVQIQSGDGSHGSKSAKSWRQQMSGGNAMAGSQQLQSSQERQEEEEQQGPPPSSLSTQSPPKAAAGYDKVAAADTQNAYRTEAPPAPPPSPTARPPPPSALSSANADHIPSSSHSDKIESLQQGRQQGADGNMEKDEEEKEEQAEKSSDGSAEERQQHELDKEEGQALLADQQGAAQKMRPTLSQKGPSSPQSDQSGKGRAAPFLPAPAPTPQPSPTHKSNMVPAAGQPGPATVQSQGAALVASRSAQLATASSMVGAEAEDDDDDQADSPFSSRVGLIQPDMLKVFAQMSGSFVPTACQTDAHCTVKGFSCSRLLNKCVPSSPSSNGQAAKCATAQLCSTDADCCAGERCDNFGGLLQRQRCRRGDSQSNITSVISSSGRTVPGSSSAQLPQSLMSAASSPIKGRSSSLPSSSDRPSASIVARRLPLNAPTKQVAPPQSAQQDQDKPNSQEASTTVNLASNSTFPSGSNVTQIAAPADQDQSQDSFSANDSQQAKETQSASVASSGSGEGSDQQAQQGIQLAALDGQQSAFAARGAQASGRGVKVNAGASVSSSVGGPVRLIPAQQVEQEVQSQDSSADDQTQGRQSSQSANDQAASKSQSIDNAAAPANDGRNQGSKPKNLSLSKLLVNSQPRNVAQLADLQEKSLKLIASGSTDKQASSSNTPQVY